MKRLNIIAVFFFIAAGLFVMFGAHGEAAAAGASAWNISTVDTTGGAGWDTSIALDSSGLPHISYYDVGNGDLKHAYFDGEGWQLEVVDGTGDVGQYTSMAVDSQGGLHISYYDVGNGDLKHAYFDGGIWQPEVVDGTGDVGRYTSMAVDSQDGLHISYYDATNGDLKYARYDGAQWIVETVDSAGNVGMHSSIALDSGDMPHISYYDASRGDLKYARYDGTQWVIEAVDITGNTGQYTSIAVDSQNMPHISYYDATNGDLRYARFDGEQWVFETVDGAESDAGLYTSIALDPFDLPHIAYYDRAVEKLKYARHDGIKWNIEEPDNAEAVGEYASLSLDGYGMPHISYYDGLDHFLLYATYSGCTYSIRPSSASFGPEGGTGSIDVLDSGQCGWTAESSDEWIYITSGSSGTGQGTVEYSVDPNNDGLTCPRSGTITVASGVTAAELVFTINQAGTNRPPVIDSFTADPLRGDAPLDVTFTCSARDPDSEVLQYEWDFDGDGAIDTTTTEGTATFSYQDPGEYDATVTVVDGCGTGVTSTPVKITAGSPGGEEATSNLPNCFIATAAYGSRLAPQVEVLREFRDRHLLTNPAGRLFVGAYYRCSPPVAGFIARHDTARVLVRAWLAPLVYGVKYPWVFGLILGIAAVLAAGAGSRRRR